MPTKQRGWLYLLSGQSGWGSPESLHDAIEFRRSGAGIIESDVWGRLNRKGLQPKAGDGIGFYHTRRAAFPPEDAHRRRPRVSLIGTVDVLEMNGQELKHIRARVDRALAKRLKQRPIVRDESTEHLFQQCGMVRGSIASMYEAPPDVWSALVKLATTVPEVSKPDAFNTKVGSSVASPPETVQATVVRVVRDTKAARTLKDLYEDRCQVCSKTISLGAGRGYSEVHHVRPLGGGHKGLDRHDNMMVLCPTHHAMFDLGLPRFVDTATVHVAGKAHRLTYRHTINARSIQYHNANLHVKLIGR